MVLTHSLDHIKYNLPKKGVFATPFDALARSLIPLKYWFFPSQLRYLIGERSKPHSDNLDGELFISSHTFVCLSLYTVYIRLITRVSVKYDEILHE